MEEKREMEAASQQELLQSSLEIQEATLRRVGLELHDNISPTISVVGLHLSSLGENLEGKPKEKVQQLEKWLRKAIEDIRMLSHSLNVDQVRNKELVQVLKELASQIQGSGKIQCSVSVDGTSETIEPNHCIILFRMCQELVNNALRHSEGDKLTIQIQWAQSHLNINIADNGNGISPAGHTKGHGLHNVASRAKVISATFALDSKPGIGTLAKIKYPIARKEQASHLKETSPLLTVVPLVE